MRLGNHLLPQVFPLAAAFVGYVVLWNLSLQLNPVGFYQLAKIAITPAIIAIEAAFYAKRPTRAELAAVAVLCMGVTLATITDDQARPRCRLLSREMPAGHRRARGEHQDGQQLALPGIPPRSKSRNGAL